MSMIAIFLRVSNDELEEYLQNSELLEERIGDENIEENPNYLYIDKAWDGIIFLLTGESFQNTKHDLVKIIFSGQIVDEEQDLGYGPAHYLLPEQVRNLSEKIAMLGRDELRSKYDPQKMMKSEVYPSIWNEGDDAFDYLFEYFEQVKDFFKKASQNGQAVISLLS